MTVITTVRGYLDGPYLTEPYATGNADGATGWQANFSIDNSADKSGMQAELHYLDKSQASGMQAELHFVDQLVPKGLQSLFQIMDKQVPKGVQTEFKYVDKQTQMGMQGLFSYVDRLNPQGIQATFVTLKPLGFQALATLYNTTNLRILSSFPSRGLNTTNWTASSTEPGDFGVENLDTDIIEQVWRSATGVKTGIDLTTDTGLPQGVFLDTFAILGHNMTRSASVILYGADNPGFSPVGITIPLEPRSQNMFYISPELPTAGWRYWRISIDDTTNPNNFVSIGAVLFGAAGIFHGECFVDELEFELRDFTDTVRTEGFTNVSNSRTQKRRVRLEFRTLDSNLQNFKLLRGLFENVRTVLKCLWIPTPSPVSQEVSARFAVFGKLTQIPSEKHNNKGPDADYVSFNLEIDESM